MPTLKAKILRAFINHFEGEMSALAAAAQSAHEAATHEESKAEDQHDTRGIEASYLAGAQTARVAELKQVILEYRSLLGIEEVRAGKGPESIGVGALITVQPVVSADDPKPKGAPLRALFAAHGGGTSVLVDGANYSVFTPSSPIGEALLSGQKGDVVEIESKAGNRAYRIISIE